jgi:flagellar FliL protein
MAENEKTQETGEEQKKKPILLFIIIGLLVLLLAVAGGAFFFLYSAPSDEKIAEEIAQEEAQEPKPQEKKSEAEIGVTVPLKPFVVNLADPKARHFLKATIVLEVDSDKTKEEVDKLLPRIRNDIIMLLSSQTLEDVISIEGKVRLRDGIAARIGRIIGSEKLLNVYFDTFVVQ